MSIRQLIAGINTPKLADSRDFYVRHFGFEVIFDNGWYVELRRPASALAFLAPHHPSQPPIFQSSYTGAGVWISLEVENVDAERERLGRALPIALELRDEPWGERHFAVLDPNGIPVNVTKMMHAPDASAVY